MKQVLSIRQQGNVCTISRISEAAEQARPVQISSLGGLSIRIHGKDVAVQSWKSPKVYQLLSMIVAMGGRNIPLSALYDALWGDMDGDKAMQNMEFILRRLRQILHQEIAGEVKPGQIIQLNNAKVSLNAEYCQLDLWGWENLAEQARKLRHAGQPGQARASEQLAADMLSGSFLAGDDDLVFSQRRLWHTRLCNWIDEVIDHWRNDDAVTHAEKIALLDAGLAISPCSEKLCMQRMQVLLAEGCRVDAMRAFKDWSLWVKEAYGIHPSGKIHQMYTAIQQGA